MRLAGQFHNNNKDNKLNSSRVESTECSEFYARWLLKWR